MTEIQRARLLTAVIATIAEFGYAGMTVTEVSARAKVSRRTFYDLFADREDCFLAAFEQAHARAWRAATEACDWESGWRERVRCGLGRLLVLIEEEPGHARLWIVEALGAGERVRNRRAEALQQFASVVHEGRLAADGERKLPDIAALAVVGGVCAVLYACLLGGAGGAPTELLNPLMSMIVLPYLGPAVAELELGRAPLAPRRRPPSPQPGETGDLADLELRPTYRTVRVLMAIASHPGLSNRAVAAASGILDEGQGSKLLKRLAGLELIENRSQGEKAPARAWHLTPRGARLERAFRTDETR